MVSLATILAPIAAWIGISNCCLGINSFNFKQLHSTTRTWLPLTNYQKFGRGIGILLERQSSSISWRHPLVDCFSLIISYLIVFIDVFSIVYLSIFFTSVARLHCFLVIILSVTAYFLSFIFLLLAFHIFVSDYSSMTVNSFQEVHWSFVWPSRWLRSVKEQDW